MSRVASGFLKAAIDPGVYGMAGGALLGFGLVGGSVSRRLGGALFGATIGQGVGSGIGGLVDDPDFSGLTPGEIEVLREEAEHQARWRNLTRIMAAGGGIVSAALMKSPAPLLAAIPAATIAPIGHDATKLRHTAKNFRDARRSS